MRIWLLGVLSTFVACTGTSPSSETINVAAAANMQFAAKEIVKAYKEAYDQDIQLIIASSGKLTAQIKAGAPYHVFLSADTKYPMELYEEGLATSAPEIYAYGELAIAAKSALNLSTDHLSNSSGKIAIPNPRIAPYGIAAAQYLNSKGLMESLEKRLVYGESISQVNQFMKTGAVEFAFTSVSSVIMQYGPWIKVEGTYAPIAQSMVIIDQKGSSVPNPHTFKEFLFSNEAKNILMKYGYRVP